MRNMMETNQKMAMAPAAITIKNDMAGIMQFLGTPKGKLAQFELLTIFTGILFLFLVIFGSYRRRCSGNIFRLICFMAYNLSTYVLAYAITLMREIPSRDEFSPLWLGYLETILSSSDSFSAFSLEDNEQWKSYSWQRAIKLFWVYWLLGLSPDPSAGNALNLLFFILALRCDERAEALRAASQSSLERNNKIVADYMSEEHKNGGDVDPVSMRGYKYLVTGEEKRRAPAYVRAGRWILRRIRRIRPRWITKKEVAQAPGDQTPLDNEDQLITIEKVWSCEGRLLSSEGDPHNKLKDKCLSFALFKLLRLRYAGHSLPQEAHKKTWNLIRRGLLSKEDGYKRAFRVIEVELTFLFDFFYTKYSIIFEPEVQLFHIMKFIYFVFNIQCMTTFLIDYESYDYDNQLGTMLNGLNVEVFITIMMMILFTTAELMQLIFIGFTEWAKVTLICKYVQRKSWQNKLWVERIIRVICEAQWMTPWEQKLHQYSFLESYSYKPCWLLKSKMMANYIDLTKDGQRQSKPIKLPEEVKQAVFHALKSNCSTKLESGQASLRLNNVSKKLSWACCLETQTQVIMVWHIATSFCEGQRKRQPVESSDSPEMKRNFLVATSLSKYLAYLVAFAPELLPDHPYVAEHVFDQAIIKARDFFRGCKSMDDRIRKMEGNGGDSFVREETIIGCGARLGTSFEAIIKGRDFFRGCKRMVDRIRKMEGNGGDSFVREETIIGCGARLGNQLTTDIRHKDMIWRILANFWAELVLYVAPSNNAKVHAEHLSRGGEFMTHLWALLFHAGLERDPPRKALERSNSF